MGLIDGFKNAFSTKQDNKNTNISDARRDELLLKIANIVIQKKMETPIILFLESVRPLNNIGSQAMHFLKPAAASIFNAAVWDELAILLEDRENIDRLLEMIEDGIISSKEND